MLENVIFGASPTRLLTMIAALALLLVFWAIGKAVTRRGVVEAQWAVGWGVVALVLTLVGVVGVPLWLGALAVVPLVVLGAGRLREDGAALAAFGRVVMLGLPFLWVVAAMNVSAVDTFTHWLPNAVQLYDHHAFPTLAAPGATVAYPAFPYNFQFVFYLIGLVVPYQPDTALLAFNGVLIIVLALVLARVMAGGQAVPSWGTSALAVLLATLLNPTFVPPIALVPYGDFSTSLLVMVAAWLLWRTVEAAPGGATPALQAGLVLAALVTVKQANPALTGIIVIAFVLLALARRETRGTWLVRRLAAAALPPLVILVAWRLYVAHHLPGGENQMLPWDAWQWHNLPAIGANILKVMSQKIGYFTLMIAITVAAVAGLVRRRSGPLHRLAVLTGLIFLGYNAFLVMMYLGHFQGSSSTGIQSYWRFNTQLGPLALLVAVMAIGPWMTRRGWTLPPGSRQRQGAVALAIVLCMAGPVLGSGHLRVDIKDKQAEAWAMAEDLAREVPADRRLDVVVPGDVGNLTWAMHGAIKHSAVRRADLAVHTHNRLPATLGPDTDLVWLACVPDGHEAVFGQPLPTGKALLLERSDGDQPWQTLRTWEPDTGFCR